MKSKYQLIRDLKEWKSFYNSDDQEWGFLKDIIILADRKWNSQILFYSIDGREYIQSTLDQICNKEIQLNDYQL